MSDLPDLATMARSGAWPELAALLAADKNPKYTFSVLCSRGYLRPAQSFLFDHPTLKLNRFGNGFFHDACIKGHLEYTQWLHQQIIAQGRDQDLMAARERGMMVSCRKGDLVMTQWLFQQGVSRKELLYNLGEACKYGHLDVVQWLVEQIKTDLPAMKPYFLWSFKEKSFQSRPVESTFRPALTTWLWGFISAPIPSGKMLRKTKSIEAVEWLQEHIPNLDYTSDRYYLVKLKDQGKFEVLAWLASFNPVLALTPAEEKHVIFRPVSGNYRYEGQ